ncbi:hypothetical protein OSTOST_05347 [Ostertagia ostertagi]
MGCGASVSLAVLLPLSYVGLLHIVDHDGTDRNDPQSIRKRSIAAVVNNVLSVAITYFVLCQVGYHTFPYRFHIAAIIVSFQNFYFNPFAVLGPFGRQCAKVRLCLNTKPVTFQRNDPSPFRSMGFRAEGTLAAVLWPAVLIGVLYTGQWVLLYLDGQLRSMFCGFFFR